MKPSKKNLKNFKNNNKFFLLSNLYKRNISETKTIKHSFNSIVTQSLIETNQNKIVYTKTVNTAEFNATPKTLTDSQRVAVEYENVLKQTETPEAEIIKTESPKTEKKAETPRNKLKAESPVDEIRTESQITEIKSEIQKTEIRPEPSLNVINLPEQN